MKILADSNIFVDFWKNPTNSMIDTFTNENVVVCGVIRAELLHGAKSSKNLEEINSLLDEFEEITFDQSDWKMLGNELYQLRTNGITIPFGDAIIAHLAIRYHLKVWTRDKHFDLIKSVLTDLQLYE